MVTTASRQVTESNSGSHPRRSASSAIAIVCGVWFLLTGWIWTFLFNIVFSYPVGLLGFFVWIKARKLNPGDKKNAVAIVLLALGLAVSLVALALFK